MSLLARRLALIVALPGLVLSARGQSPGELREVRGRLEVLQGEDLERGRGEVIVTVRQRLEGLLPEQGAAAVRLHFPGAVPEGLASGAEVRVVGRARADGGVEVAAVSDGSAAGIEVLAPADLPLVSGTQRAIVMLVNFQDKALSTSATPAALADLMFGPSGSIDAYYRTVSQGALGFSGDVVGPFTIPYSSSATDYTNWGTAADQEAQKAGVNLNNYARKVYVMPSNGTGYGGVANVGGSVTRAWIFVWNNKMVYAHELGHNLGLRHASTAADEYGDDSCVMGNPNGMPSLNAPHLTQMGWLPEGRILTVSQGGTYTLTALATQTTQVQALRIPVPNSSSAVYVSYRNNRDQDATIPTAYSLRTSVHTWAGTGVKTLLVGNLDDGQSWTDPSTGMIVQQISDDGLTATVLVSFQALPMAPSASVAPAASSARPGASASYAVSLRNNDSLGSPPARFDLAVAPPSGWTVSVSPASLTLGPGESGSATITVTSAATDADALVPLTLDVRDGQQPLHSLTRTFSHYVDGTAPPAPAGLTASGSKRRIQLSWSSSAANEPLGVVYVISRDGAEIARTSGTSYTDSVNGTYAYAVVALDPAGNASPASAVTGSSSSGGGGGGGGKGRNR